MKRLLALGFLFGLIGLVVPAPAADTTDKAAAKEALKELQDFIGGWKGNGGPDKPRPSRTDPIWEETVSWGWRFKGDDAWLTMSVNKGKIIKSGELRFLPDKKVYQLTVIDDKDKKTVYQGQLKRETLTLESIDPDTKQTRQIKMNVAAEGVRFNYWIAHKDQGSTIWKKDYKVAFNKEGESLGKVEKKNLCVVSGGIGTMAISYKGETYYVCCSGCAEAFRETPEKYIAEFKAKKGKK